MSLLKDESQTGKAIKINKPKYTVIENEMIRDERLSYNARGILATIISYLDEWDFSFLLEYLTRNSPDNELSVEDGLNELKNLGYL